MISAGSVRSPDGIKTYSRPPSVGVEILSQPKEGLGASATSAAVAYVYESNARVTISATLVADVAGWDDSRNARLPPGYM